MSETSQAPQQGIAEALHDLSDHTAALARREVSSAVREMWDKARQQGSAAGLMAGGGVLALAATASAYRLSLRLLEKRLSPAAAALAATVPPCQPAAHHAAPAGHLRRVRAARVCPGDRAAR